MKQYIGIDLGTTNSAICSFVDQQTRIWKSPEQSDVTPSAIYVDKHGHRFYGRRAYEMAPVDEKNAAILFKRYLGTSMKFHLQNSQEVLTPEECSAEVLRLLFGYLPSEWRSSPETVTVITVPAAFNQMKKDATLQAAEMAKIGQVAIMQEPVAAVMSVMKEAPVDGIFLVYDLGGGTFDISVAEHTGGRVNLLAQGGKEMCGGRDWDRLMMRNIVFPWLQEHFSLPENADQSPDFRRLRQLTLFACEQAKIELSLREETYIRMDEDRIAQKDLKGKEIYLDIPVTREQLTDLIKNLLQTTVEVARETVRKTGVQSESIRQIVFIGGPTVYPPLQSYVMDALKIQKKGSANPMTAVAEGASIFAESIDWASDLLQRQEVYHQLSGEDFDIRYEHRIAADEGKIALISKNGGSFSAEAVSSADGWTSGRISFQKRGLISVPLRVPGENRFRIRLFDEDGREIFIGESEILIQKVLASVNAIPSSHAIALKVLDQVGGKAVPVYLVRENEKLPKRGNVSLRAGKRLIADSHDKLFFTLWEGEIEDPIEDNRYIGTYQITGDSFSSGVIAVGAEIICEYEISESGHLNLGVTVPSVGAVFAKQNFYSRKEGQLNLEDPSELLKSVHLLQNRILHLRVHSSDVQLARLSIKLDRIEKDIQNEDPEMVQQAANDLLDCQREIARYRQEHLREFRLADLQSFVRLMEEYQSELSTDAISLLDTLYDEARRAIDHHGENYESALMKYRREGWRVLQNSESFIRDQFYIRIKNPDQYKDPVQFHKLKAEGLTHLENHDMMKLKRVISALNAIEKPEIRVLDAEKMYEDVNVLRG